MALAPRTLHLPRPRTSPRLGVGSLRPRKEFRCQLAKAGLAPAPSRRRLLREAAVAALATGLLTGAALAAPAGFLQNPLPTLQTVGAQLLPGWVPLPEQPFTECR